MLIKIKHMLGRAYDKIILYKNFFLFKCIWYKPRVMTPEGTISRIIQEKLSVSRFGDGEFRLMTEQGCIGFQKANKQLSTALIKAFNVRSDKILICSYNFSKKRPKRNYYSKWLINFISRYYRNTQKLFDRHYIYGDTDITRFYSPAFFKHTDFDYLQNYYIPLLKKIWEDRNLLIVEGEQTKLGTGNDLFNNANSIRRIICPAQNAFDKIDEIEKHVQQYYNDGDLVLLALGPTASVLSIRMATQFSMQCIDIGHVDIVYMWYLNKCTLPSPIDGKYVNEAIKHAPLISCKFDEDKYKHQIIDTVL